MKKTLFSIELAARDCRDAAALADKLSEEHFEEDAFAPAVMLAARAMDAAVARVHEATLAEIDAALEAHFDADVAERRGLILALIEETPDQPGALAAQEDDQDKEEGAEEPDDGDDEEPDVEFDELVNELTGFSAKIREVATHLDSIAASLRARPPGAPAPGDAPR